MQNNQQPSLTGDDGRKTQGKYAPVTFPNPYPFGTYCPPVRPNMELLMPNPDVGRVNVWTRVHRRRVMARVMAQPELLEMVFLHLDLQTLMVSVSRVCRVWKEVLGSPQMKRLIQEQTNELNLLRDHMKNEVFSTCTGYGYFDEDDDL